VKWSEWAESVFGTPKDIWHDGLAVERFDRLSTDERSRAISLLPEGIEARDHVAAVGARRLGATEVLRNLEAVLPEGRGLFLIETARAIDALGGDTAAAVRQVLSVLPRDPVWSFRMDILIGLRHLPGPDVVDSLLLAVEHDPEYLCRYHAAESLLHLGELEPLTISDHGDLFPLVASDEDDDHAAAAQRLREVLGVPKKVDGTEQ
jgi:hypothetical protein